MLKSTVSNGSSSPVFSVRAADTERRADGNIGGQIAEICVDGLGQALNVAWDVGRVCGNRVRVSPVRRGRGHQSSSEIFVIENARFVTWLPTGRLCRPTIEIVSPTTVISWSVLTFTRHAIESGVESTPRRGP